MQPCFDDFCIDESLRLRWGRWNAATADVRGAIIYLSGRAEFLEKNKEAFAYLSRAGFAVYSFDWRGQGLSSRMLENPHKGYVRDFDDYLGDLQQFMERIFLPETPARRVMIGHSMGGHIGLRYLHDHGNIVDRAVLISPMFDINTSPLPRCLVAKTGRTAVRRGLGSRYLPGAGDYNVENKRFAGNRLTGDPERFMHEIREIQKNPNLALGGATYGWLAAAFDSIDTIHSPGYPEEVTTPILLASGKRDRVVCRKAHARICRRLQNCRLVPLREARHEILKETDAIQHQFWQTFEAFVAS